MIKTLLQFEKKRKMISRQRRKIVIFNVKELKVENPCGISFRGIGLHIIHDVEIFTALVFLRTLSNHKLWECACPYSLHRSAPREGFEYVQSSRWRRPDQPQRCLSLPPSVSRAPEKANLTSRTVLSCLAEG